MLKRRKDILWLILFVCFVAGFAFFAGVSSQKQIDKQSAPAHEQDNKNHSADYAAAIFSTIDRIFTDNDKAIAGVSALLLVVVTGGLALVANRQLKDTRALQRAYITVVPLGVAPFVSGQPYLSCDVGMRNVGHLPAKNVRWWFLTTYSEDRDEEFAIPAERVTDGPIIIPPGLEIKKGIGPALAKDDFRRWRYQGEHEGRWLYMWGRVDYTDGFGESRFTEFCHRYNLYAAGRDFRITPEHARYHQKGNRTDEE